jgi:hypothetical protein
VVDKKQNLQSEDWQWSEREILMYGLGQFSSIEFSL